MALSLDSIYKPINDFFLNRFKTDHDSPIFFKFDKFGSVVSDESFIDPENPDDTSLAQEEFSDITNRLPVEDPDGINVLFGGNSIDSEYLRLMNASIPFTNPNDPNKEEIINSFVKIKNEAGRKWEFLSEKRGGVILDKYRISFAHPTNWYDRRVNNNWTEQSFEIKESVTTPINSNPKYQLWKLKLSDDHLKKILPVLETTKSLEPIALRKDVIKMMPALTRAGTMQTITIRDHRTKPKVVVRDHRAMTLAGTSLVNQNLRSSLHRLDLTNRLAVLHYIREKAPTKPSTTSGLSIKFDYCTVNIRRSWLDYSLIKNKSWYIPGSAKGEESAPGSEMNLSVLPVGFIAIKNLEIEANWSQVDITISKDATDFGPFEVDSEIVNNKLSHEGIQIVGWILQRMPELPPNDPPSSIQ